MARTKLKQFQTAQTAQWGQKQEEIDKLSSIEKVMIGKHLLMKIGTVIQNR